MAMIAVLGGGFGLYGHTAALAAMGANVSTLERYKPAALSREELAPLVPKITWVREEEGLIANADIVVLAQRPSDNATRCQELLETDRDLFFVIEKPIATSWQEAESLEHQLLSCRRSWAVPYLFCFCDWFQELVKRLVVSPFQHISWSHRQSPKLGIWKKDPLLGGGINAFYFIHFLALFEAICPYATIEYARNTSQNNIQLSATATDGSKTLKTTFQLGEAAAFEISDDSGAWCQQETPFGNSRVLGTSDSRLLALQRFYRNNVLIPSIKKTNENFLCNVTRHWARLENYLRE
jgi:predicted dehydrogenase